MLRHTAGALCALFLVFAVACGSDSPSDPGTPGPTSDLACIAPTLGADAAVPFDRVEVSGIEGLSEKAWVEYTTASGTVGVTALFVDATGRAEVFVPANPDDLMGGGPITLRVTDGIATCEDMDLMISAMPAATGDPVTETWTAADGLSDALAAQWGVDRAAVRSADLTTLSPQAVCVALLDETVRALDPATALDGMTPDEAAFTQAMLARLDVAAVLDQVTASVEALGGGAAAGVARPGPARALEGCGDLGTVPQGLLGISGPEKLSEYIKIARGQDDTIGPLADMIGGVSAAFGAVGVVVPQVGAVAGWASFFSNLVQQMRLNLYPSSLTKLEYRLDKSEIEEDWDDDRDPDVRWAFAKLYATNNGMGLARVGIDLITTWKGLPEGIGGATADLATRGLDFAGKDALNKRLDDLANDPDGGAECWGIGATEFGPVVVDDNTGDRWVRAEITSGDAVEPDAADIRKILPRKIGVATLRVRTQEEPFPGPFAFEDKPVRVLRKEVVWIPATLLVQNPGEPATVKFRIDNSLHNGPDDVDVVAGPGLGTLPPPTFSGGVHTIEFTTPADKQSYPTWIDALSTSPSLPPLTPERRGRLDVFADESIQISPRTPCVPNGEPQTFTATVQGPDQPTANWQIVSGGGMLSATSGETIEYTAPTSGSGTAVLRATLSTNSQITDEVSFSYGACSGLAVYYGVSAELNFPFLPGGECNNPDLDRQFAEQTFPEGGAEPLVPPDPADVWIDRSERLTKTFDEAGVFGSKPTLSDPCQTAQFQADATYDGILTGSADGSRVDIDITTEAQSNGVDMGELGIRRSSALALMSVSARWDFEFTQATDLQLDMNFECDYYQPPQLPPIGGMLTVTIVRVKPDGSIVLPTASTQPIQIPCGPTNPVVNFQRLLQFADPDEPGRKDHVMILFQASNQSFGAVADETDIQRHTGLLKGYVSVARP